MQGGFTSQMMPFEMVRPRELFLADVTRDVLRRRRDFYIRRHGEVAAQYHYTFNGRS